MGELFYEQSAYDVRCEWGIQGVRMVGGAADVVVMVDALSFSTCVEVAAARGGRVYPCRWKDERAREFAEKVGAELAVRRGEAGRFSLSPVSMKQATEGTRIVLPSPNGSELTMEAAGLGKVVVAGCFRNCAAVAKFVAGRSVAVIAAGERWADGTLRPAVEDFAAAGAIVAGLRGTKSPEALAAEAVWHAIKGNVGAFLEGCASGRELMERGFAEDVRMAAEVNVSMVVPVLCDGAYSAAATIKNGEGT